MTAHHDYPLYLAPMEDVSDPDFRLLCKRFGADRVYTEFINADALIRDVQSTIRKMQISDAERPVAIQIYGSNIDSLAQAARIVESAQPDYIDINCGCPVKKIASKGAGAGLLSDIPKLLKIVSSVVHAVTTPVTVKTRLGWDEADIHSSRLRPIPNNTPLILDLAPALQDCGIAELTIHGRTKSQMYTGNANWELIEQVKNNPKIHIPIIGNGDVTSPTIARQRFSHTNVDAIMIGRASWGCPWVFEDLNNHLLNNQPIVRTLQWACQVFKEYITAVINRLGDERKGILHCRRHLAHTPVFKGLPDFRNTKIALLRTESKTELFDLLDKIALQYD